MAVRLLALPFSRVFPYRANTAEICFFVYDLGCADTGQKTIHFRLQLT